MMNCLAKFEYAIPWHRKTSAEETINQKKYSLPAERGVVLAEIYEFKEKMKEKIKES